MLESNKEEEETTWLRTSSVSFMSQNQVAGWLRQTRSSAPSASKVLTTRWSTVSKFERNEKLHHIRHLSYLVADVVFVVHVPELLLGRVADRALEIVCQGGAFSYERGTLVMPHLRVA